MILSKRMNVYVTYLLVLFSKYKNIVNVARSIFFYYFWPNNDKGLL